MTHLDTTPTTAESTARNRSVIGATLGALGIVAAVWAYWLVLPGAALGIAAIGFGLAVRRTAGTRSGGVAIALGLVALFLVPSVLFVVDGAEDWGRECALDPANPDC